MDFIHYYTNEELEAVLQGWVRYYPQLVELRSIGMSHEQRPLWLLVLTARASGPDSDKPAVWLDANIHATEITGTSVTLAVARQLLEGYGQEERITRLLDSSTYYIMPRLNPDGAAWAMAARPRYVRSGTRPYPFAERQDGLHEEDLDGDGRILQMRLPDPNGDWKISALDPRLMEKRGPDEQGGSYYRLLPEGRVEGFDGWTIQEARPLQGLDFNRNFPFEWRPEGAQRGAGPYPASEPEIRAVVDFVTGHPNINLAVTYHTFSGVILRPSSTRPDDEMDTSDLWVYKGIGKRGSELTGYRNVAVYHDFLYHPKKVTTGAFDDWAYEQLGIFAFTIELWDLPTAAGIKERKFIEWFRDHPHEQDLQIVQWADAHAPGSVVAWYAFDHPQLGKVELGGWDFMYSWRNPPPGELEGEVRRNLSFALALGEMLPHLAVRELKVEPAGESRHLTLVVENSGFLPTCTSQQGRAQGVTLPVRVELELGEGMELVQGKRRTELGHLEGRSNKSDVSMDSGFSPTDNRARLEWVVRTPRQRGADATPVGGKLGVKIICPRGGNIRREVDL